MSGTLREGTEPSPNRSISILPAAMSTIYSYPLAFQRKDLTNQERIKYTYEWNIFDQIWAYNYTASTIGGSPWQFLNNNEHLAYRNGQISHATIYSTASISGQFDNIRF